MTPSRYVCVREYARLTTADVVPSLDQASVSASAFEWLCQWAAGFNSQGARLCQLENSRSLKLDQYVGVIETPCGTLIEILPKITEDTGENSRQRARQLLIKMLTLALDLPTRSTGQTDIETFRHPLLEWVMQQFTRSLEDLVKRGLRFDYRRVEEESRYLRGQLDVSRQLRQPPGRDHMLQIRHDLYLPNRPENRLLKTALARICTRTQQPETWRLAHELAGLLAEIPASQDIPADLKQWRGDRLMAHYQPIKPWCELVLGQTMPLSVRGQSSGISLLFPMEKLFERYVELMLRRQLADSPYTLQAQARQHYLTEHAGQRLFQLRPDLLLKHQGQTCWVLDTKWKRLNQQDRATHYGLSQSDFYQLFAYGQRYLGGQGELGLIYPTSDQFTRIDAPFDYSPELRLWVCGFNLESDTMHWPDTWRERLSILTPHGVMTR